MDCPPGQKKVAGVERWLLVEVRLHIIISGLLRPKNVELTYYHGPLSHTRPTRDFKTALSRQLRQISERNRRNK